MVNEILFADNGFKRHQFVTLDGVSDKEKTLYAL